MAHVPHSHAPIISAETLQEMMAETGWEPHSCRAFLSGVRKSGDALIKLERTDGNTAWGIALEAEAEA